ncbi:MAG: hypothetical protein LLG00_09980 [Planctomycetaceae bacterium]|nr:hypothetical protein [Planctomycetaceae bacterium]
MTGRRANRHGYALMLVMLFVVLFGAMLGVAWRRVASALRVEHALAVRTFADHGSVQALDLAMRVLETRVRRDSSNTPKIDVSADLSTMTPTLQASPCQCKVQLNVSSDPAHPQLHWYKVIFTRTGDNPDGTSAWSVGVSVAQPSEDLSSYLPMPTNPP